MESLCEKMNVILICGRSAAIIIFRGFLFYNFPYAFGQLFGMGLYSIYKEEANPSRPNTWKQAMGSLPAAEVARRAGFDIERPEFWQSAMKTFEHEVEFLEAQSNTR